MCGLVGYLGGINFSNSNEVEANLTTMTNALVHRGPDSHGHWYCLKDNIALGHRRLSIMDLSQAGHQPMQSEDSRYVIAFNGEIYNHLEIRTEIESQVINTQWKGHSDTETLLKSIQVFGWETTLSKLVGMFSIALWDCQNKQLFLARDRFGEKPLYYGWHNDTFIFGSELSPMTLHPAFEKKINKSSLALLLKHGYIPTPYSIWNNIFKLPAAHYLTISNNNTKPTIKCYWSFKTIVEQSDLNKMRLTENKAVENIENILKNSVKNQMLSDVPIGTLLSGGIDSTLIAALMQEASTKPIKTFSIGFEDPRFDESIYAEAIAKHLCTDHTTIIMRPSDLLELVPEIAKIYDEPFADSSQLPMTILSRIAKEHVTVVLSGDGADEIFGGYSRYLLIQNIWNKLDKLPIRAVKTLSHILTSVPPERLNMLLGKLLKHMNYSKLPDKLYKLGERLEKSSSLNGLYLAFMTEIDDPKIFIKNFNQNPEYLLGDISKWPKLDNPIERMMAIDTLTYLTDDILVKVDRAAMSASLELRAPYLNHNLVEYVSKIPFSLKYKNSQTKWLLRQIVYKYVPRKLLDRPKKGFSIPLNEWLRGPLYEWAEDLLDINFLEKQDIFEINEVRSLWIQHLSGNREYGARIWSILMFQAWYKNNFESV